MARSATSGLANVRREIRDHMQRSRECWSAVLDGKCLAMWGVWGDTLATDGYVWFCVSEEARKHVRMMAEASRAWLGHLLHDEGFRTLNGLILDGDQRVARYAEFLGFEILPGREKLRTVWARRIRMKHHG